MFFYESFELDEYKPTLMQGLTTPSASHRVLPMSAPDQYLGRIANTGDHVKATPDFRKLVCLASYSGAIGDCVRHKHHQGLTHQDAHGYAWRTSA